VSSAAWAAWKPWATRKTVTAPTPSRPEQLLTDPRAADFVKRTQLDRAIAIGTSHGAYKFTRRTHGRHSGHRPRAGNQPPLAQHHLVMHGSSSAPRPAGHQPVRRQDEGKPTALVEEIQKAIQFWRAQINIDTDIFAWP
jgi:fructose/tagatose bisphosphate aldolase